MNRLEVAFLTRTIRIGTQHDDAFHRIRKTKRLDTPHTLTGNELSSLRPEIEAGDRDATEVDLRESWATLPARHLRERILQDLRTHRERLPGICVAGDAGKVACARAARRPDGGAELGGLHTEHSIARSRPSLTPRAACLRRLPEAGHIQHERIGAGRRGYEKGHVDLVSIHGPRLLCRDRLVTAVRYVGAVARGLGRSNLWIPAGARCTARSDQAEEAGDQKRSADAEPGRSGSDGCHRNSSCARLTG